MQQVQFFSIAMRHRKDSVLFYCATRGALGADDLDADLTVRGFVRSGVRDHAHNQDRKENQCDARDYTPDPLNPKHEYRPEQRERARPKRREAQPKTTKQVRMKK